jgi:cytochrome c biogenesis protein ResB
MPAAAWFTLIVAALIIAITAVGLLRVIFHLRAIRRTLVSTTGECRPWPA